MKDKVAYQISYLMEPKLWKMIVKLKQNHKMVRAFLMSRHGDTRFTLKGFNYKFQRFFRRKTIEKKMRFYALDVLWDVIIIYALHWF